MTAVRMLALAGAAVLVLVPLAARSRAVAAESTTGFLNHVHKDADGKEAKYVLFVPHDFKGDKPYPVILFLHGSGERVGGKKQPVEVGIGTAVKKREKDFPCLVIFPQAQRNWQANSADAKRALDILAEVEKEYKIDGKRVYLTGLSMGGYGTWSLAIAHPDKWAAIVPICGRDDPSKAATIKDLPCWCFQGGDDRIVPPDGSRKMIAAIKEAGGKPKYTEYPGVGHNSWDKAYGTDELYDWLLKQHKK
jgi:predicted peptidase